MYIIFINGIAREIHNDIDHAKSRKDFWEEPGHEEIIESVKIGQVLDWEDYIEED